MSTLSCLGCCTHLPRSAKFCHVCGRAVRRRDYDEFLDGGTVSSSGRGPATDPASRRKYLTGLGDGKDVSPRPAATLLEQITEAEAALAAVEADAWARTAELRAARVNAPAYPAARELDAHQRHAYVVFMAAEERHERSQRRYEAARNKLHRLLAMWDACSRPDLGLPPGPEEEEIVIRGNRSRF